MSINANDTVTIRVQLSDKLSLSRVTEQIAQLNGDINGIDVIKVENHIATRDITVNVLSQDHADSIVKALKSTEGLDVVNVSDRVFLLHIGGKITVNSKSVIKNREQLSLAYTPGVAKICMAIHDDPHNVRKLTIKRNMVAVVTDGSAVLGLGNIGPEAALPVMEGKAMIFKDFAGVDAFPICLDTQDSDEIIKTVKNLAPVFGGINLEDIASPRCFEIEDRLKEILDIPVFHDDQHGTAIVVAAGIINALRLTQRKPKSLKVIVNGVGAAGTACTKILLELGVTNIIGCDLKGAIHSGRDDLSKTKQAYLKYTNPNNESGTLSEVIENADVFIGLSAPNVLKVKDLKAMNKNPIVFAMANPTPEIMPEVARPFVSIMATGRSDYPNQINNALAFPGIFRGALDCQATDINEAMKVAAAYAIAHVIDEAALSPDYIIPSIFDQKVVKVVAEAVSKAAYETGVAQR